MDVQMEYVELTPEQLDEIEWLIVQAYIETSQDENVGKALDIVMSWQMQESEAE